MLPPSPDAQRWKERRYALVVGFLVLLVGFLAGFWFGWKFCASRLMQQAAEQVIGTAEAYRAAQCASLAPELYPPC